MPDSAGLLLGLASSPTKLSSHLRLGSYNFVYWLSRNQVREKSEGSSHCPLSGFLLFCFH